MAFASNIADSKQSEKSGRDEFDLRVLVVDDQETLSNAICEQLNASKFDAFASTSLTEIMLDSMIS